mmetsp:Transcript_10997/g.36249  ORF Transcript_10997/g.36249 Transcript_10997/m.36249 type:complete len:209 (-) Transcript_10997:42-668(-)
MCPRGGLSAAWRRGCHRMRPTLEEGRFLACAASRFAQSHAFGKHIVTVCSLFPPNTCHFLGGACGFFYFLQGRGPLFAVCVPYPFFTHLTVRGVRFIYFHMRRCLTHALFLSVSLPPSVSGVTTRPSSGAQLLQRLRSISATARSSAPNCSTAQRQYRPLICALSAVVVAEAIGSPRFVASAASARQARNAVTALPTRSAHLFTAANL